MGYFDQPEDLQSTAKDLTVPKIRQLPHKLDADIHGRPVFYDPDSPEGQRYQLMLDILRNVGGAPEAGVSMLTNMAAQAGTGLGVMAGALRQKLRGDTGNLDDAIDTIGENVDRYTRTPRTEGAEEVMRGAEIVGEPIDKALEFAGQETGRTAGSYFGASPETQAKVSAGTYALGNVIGLEELATIGALRKGGSLPSPEISGREATPQTRHKQRGIWDPASIFAQVPELGPLFKSEILKGLEGGLLPHEKKGLKGKDWLTITESENPDTMKRGPDGKPIPGTGRKMTSYGGVLMRKGKKGEGSPGHINASKKEIQTSRLDQFLGGDNAERIITPEEIAEYLQHGGGLRTRTRVTGSGKETRQSPYHQDFVPVGPATHRTDAEIWADIDQRMPPEWPEDRVRVKDSSSGYSYSHDFDTPEDALEWIRGELSYRYNSNPSLMGFDNVDDYYRLSPNEQWNLANQYAEYDPAGFQARFYKTSPYPVDRTYPPNATNYYNRVDEFNRERANWRDPTASNAVGSTASYVQRTHPQVTPPNLQNEVSEILTILESSAQTGHGEPHKIYRKRMEEKYGGDLSQMSEVEKWGLKSLEETQNMDPHARNAFYHGHFGGEGSTNVLNWATTADRMHQGYPSTEAGAFQSDWAQHIAKEAEWDPEKSRSLAEQRKQLEKEQPVATAQEVRDVMQEIRSAIPAIDAQGSNLQSILLNMDSILEPNSTRPPLDAWPHIHDALYEARQRIHSEQQAARAAGDDARFETLDALMGKVEDLQTRQTRGSERLNWLRRQSDAARGQGMQAYAPHPWKDVRETAYNSVVQVLRQAALKGHQFVGFTPGRMQGSAIWGEGNAYGWRRADDGMSVQVDPHVLQGIGHGHQVDPTSGEQLRHASQEKLKGGGGKVYPLIDKNLTGSQQRALRKTQDAILEEIARNQEWHRGDPGYDKFIASLRKRIETEETGYFGQREEGMLPEYEQAVPEAVLSVLRQAGIEDTDRWFKTAQEGGKADWAAPVFENPAGNADLPGFNQNLGIHNQVGGRFEAPSTKANQVFQQPAELTRFEALEALRADPASGVKRHEPYDQWQHMLELNPELALKLLRGEFSMFAPPPPPKRKK